MSIVKCEGIGWGVGYYTIGYSNRDCASGCVGDASSEVDLVFGNAVGGDESAGVGIDSFHEGCPDGGGTAAASDLGAGAFVDEFAAALAVVETDPYAGDEAGGESGEPGVGVVVGGAGLAGRRSSEAEAADGTACAPIDDLTEQVDHLVGQIGRDRLADGQGVGEEGGPLGVQHAVDQGWFDVQAGGYQGAVGGGHFEDSHLIDSQSDAHIGTDCALETQALGKVGDLLGADLFGDLYGGGVGRKWRP